jgi:hypothetical protein
MKPLLEKHVEGADSEYTAHRPTFHDDRASFGRGHPGHPSRLFSIAVPSTLHEWRATPSVE